MSLRYIFTGQPKEIIGYASPLSARPGDTVEFKVHSPHAPYDARLVRLLDAPKDRQDRTFEEAIECPGIEGQFPPQAQRTDRGSYLTLPTPKVDLGAKWTLALYLYPTLPLKTRRRGETVVDWGSESGVRLTIGIDVDRRLFARVIDAYGDEHFVSSPAPVLPSTWYQISLHCTSEGFSLRQNAVSPWIDQAHQVATPGPVDLGGIEGSPMLIARQFDESEPSYYNGKIDRVQLLDATSQPAVSWDFSRRPSTSIVEDVGPHRLTGAVHRLPTRAAAGVDWDGNASDLAGTASRTAIHFHEGDLEDAGWTTSFTVRLPHDIVSGAYAMRLESNGDVDHVPFFVAPALEQVVPQDRVAVVIPTYTYTAYANMHTDVFDGTMDSILKGQLPTLCAEEDYIQRRHEDLLGLSLYDPHVDGNSTVYSTRRRPMLHVRPHYRLWKTGLPRGYSADLLLLGWLQRQGIEFDVLTDEQVDFDDENPLQKYRVVLTGDHPEYITRVMRDRFAAYVADGGRLTYLGGNGFCWVTAASRERPYFVEVRRGHGGSGGSPDSLAGEEVLSLTGEQGGAWDFRGMSAQSLLGVGTTACGWVSGAPYARTEASRAGHGLKVFAGLEDHDLIGAKAGFPGAAGDEIDRADRSLGTPAATVVLATSAGLHDDYYYGLKADYQPYDNAGLAGGPTKIRADMTLTCNPRGGAVFSASSVAWMLGLREELEDQSVSKVTRNVIDLFLGDDIEVA